MIVGSALPGLLFDVNVISVKCLSIWSIILRYMYQCCMILFFFSYYNDSTEIWTCDLYVNYSNLAFTLLHLSVFASMVQEHITLLLDIVSYSIKIFTTLKIFKQKNTKVIFHLFHLKIKLLLPFYSVSCFDGN